MEYDKHREHKEHKEHELKTEHAGSHPVPQRSNKRNSKFVVMAVLLGLLIVVAGMQSMELVDLKKSLGKDAATLAVSGGKSASGSGSSSDTLKKNLQNLPQMVGGC